MVHDLLHGHVMLAAHDNALAVLAVAAGLLAWLNWSVREWRGQQPPGRPGWLSPAIIVIMVAWMILRNLPWAPFAALRPA